MTTAQYEPVFTVNELADLVRVSRHRVYGWISDGHVSVVKTTGGNLRIRKSEVDRIMGVSHES